MDALVFCSFGVASRTARENSLDSIARLLAEKFPHFTVFQAYTSAIIQKRLARQNINILSLPQILAKLYADGYERVVIQPSHLTPGEEFNKKIIQAAKEWQEKFKALAVGEPIFAAPADYEQVLTAILPHFNIGDNEELVLIGHGSPHQHNPVYENLQQTADYLNLKVTLGVLEASDTPNLAMVIDRLHSRQIKNILLAPLLLASGSHVSSDIFGSHENSWQTRLLKEGFKVRADKRGLGELASFQNLYIAKAKAAIYEITDRYK